MAKFQLTVNGVAHAVDAAPERTLLSVLREDLELTGTRYGCGEGQCGACTVLVAGSAVRSCLVRAADVKGPVSTVEGLEANGKLHGLQEAFLDAGAFQCGFCTSGMIMSAAALLKKNPHPGDEEILQAMQGNICRCGMFLRIGNAIRAAAAKQGGRA